MSEVNRLEMDHKGLPFVDENGVYVLYEAYTKIKAERDALAAEMSVMDAIHDKCVFITDDDYDACPKSVQEIIRSLAVMKIPATTTYLNSVRAEGVEMLRDSIPDIESGIENTIDLHHYCNDFAAQLRAGKDGE